MRLSLMEVDPPQRLLMGPGPVNAHPRVLRAMSAQLLGQFDPEFTAYMNETMAAYRLVFETENRWTFLIDGTARAAIEAALVSLLEPGDGVVIASCGRFGGLLIEIAERCGAEPVIVSAPWGQIVPPAEIAAAIARHRPRVFACVHGDTSTTMAQPMDGIAEACRAAGTLFYVDATATIAGMATPADAWGADIITGGLQKCLGGPSGIAPITISERAAERIFSRRHVEKGLAGTGGPTGNGARIASNYFDLAMIMDYWSEKRLNHHTESTTLLYGARECARLVLEEGLEDRFARHALCSKAVSAGIEAMGLTVYGDKAHKMANVTGVVIPEGLDSETVRTLMREEFSIEIGSSFGPLNGKIWRIGAMGYNAKKPAVLTTLAALEAVLRGVGAKVRSGAGVDAARVVFEAG
jgi:(S)-ureidoglycine---glyoxylate transaminase